MEIARQKADDLVHRDMIVVEAQRRAEQIVTQARLDAEATRRDADDYVVAALNHLQSELEKLTNQVRNGIRTVEEDQARRAPSPQPTTRKINNSPRPNRQGLKFFAILQSKSQHSSRIT